MTIKPFSQFIKEIRSNFSDKDDVFGANFSDWNMSKFKKIGTLRGFSMFFVNDSRFFRNQLQIYTNDLSYDEGIFLYDDKRSLGVGGIVFKSEKGFNYPKGKIVGVSLINPEYQGKGIGLSLYENIILKMNYTLVSDETHSIGGERVWSKLARNRKIRVYAMDMTIGFDDKFYEVEPKDISINSSPYGVYEKTLYRNIKETRRRMDRIRLKYDRAKSDLEKAEDAGDEGEVDKLTYEWSHYGEELLAAMDEIEYWEDRLEQAGVMDIRLVATSKDMGKSESLKEAIEHMEYDKDGTFGVNFDSWTYWDTSRARKIGNFKGFTVYQDESLSLAGSFFKLGSTFLVVDENVHKAAFVLVYDKIHNKMVRSTLSVTNPLYRGKKIGSDFYKWLIKKKGYTFLADETQTEGGMYIWKQLAKDKNIFVYAGDMRTGDTFSVNQKDLSKSIKVTYENVTRVELYKLKMKERELQKRASKFDADSFEYQMIMKELDLVTTEYDRYMDSIKDDVYLMATRSRKAPSLKESAPTNSVGTGAVAGTGHGKDDEGAGDTRLGVVLNRIKRKKKKDKRDDC